MRNLNIRKGNTINFLYAKEGEIPAPRTGIIEQVKRSAGKSSHKANRGKKLIIFTVAENGVFKSFHFNRMSNIQVNA